MKSLWSTIPRDTGSSGVSGIFTSFSGGVVSWGLVSGALVGSGLLSGFFSGSFFSGFGLGFSGTLTTSVSLAGGSLGLGSSTGLGLGGSSVWVGTGGLKLGTGQFTSATWYMGSA